MFEKKKNVRIFGQHKYINDIGLCQNGCKCFVKRDGTTNGPAGIDPHGICPSNPKNKAAKDKSFTENYKYIIDKKIWRLKENIKKLSFAYKKTLQRAKDAEASKDHVTSGVELRT